MVTKLRHRDTTLLSVSSVDNAMAYMVAAESMVTWHEKEAEAEQAAPRIRRGWCPREWGKGGATGKVVGKPVQGNGGKGGNRRGRRETAVEKSRKEGTDRVARHQASRWNRSMLYSCRQLLQLVRTSSSFVAFFLFALCY